MNKYILLTALAVIFSAVLLAQNNSTYNDDQNMIVTVDQEAHYPEGEMAMFQYIYQHIKWPDLHDRVVDETMMVSFNVLVDSTLADIEVMSGIDPLIDQAVVRVLKGMKFAPSVQLGTAVKMNLMMNIPIRHRFE
ncbi:MAG: hypothetical protein ABIJ16_04660 [Bacteroidota bacterium]